jgi:hypothetical protein
LTDRLVVELVAALRPAVREELQAVLAERPGDVLDVKAVQARYGLPDKRLARAVMREAGAFKVGRRLYVHRDALERSERIRVEHAAPRRPATGRARPAGKPATPQALSPRFWEEE